MYNWNYHKHLILVIVLILVAGGCSSEPATPTPAPFSTAPATATPLPQMTEPPTLTLMPPTAMPTTPPSTAPPATLDPGPVDLWEDATEVTIGTTGDWTNKVELADINGDGLVDILFANGGDYDTPGEPVASQVFLNQGPGELFNEVTQDVFGPDKMLTRVIKVRDVSGDGYPDILMGTTFQTQSQLYFGDGSGKFTNVTATNLPGVNASIGDLEFGDVDGDGDLDVVLADWGPESPLYNEGGRTMLWLNDGMGKFSDVTETNMPDILVKFSWELEFVDVDNDYDLDILISCKVCAGSFFFENDGKGVFADATQSRLPQFTNNYEFEAMDVNADGYLDLVTINDGPSFSEHIFLNDGQGGFEDATAALWPATDTENRGYDDNMDVFLDFDSDGDADILIGSLDGPDRVLMNDGSGHLMAAKKVFSGVPTIGTLGIAVSDLNGDQKLDVVQAQGEAATPEKVYLGKNIQPDSAPPLITLVEQVGTVGQNQAIRIHARVHDNKSPTIPQDWESVELLWTVDGQTQSVPMQWYGEYLWSGTIDQPPAGSLSYQVCATDAAGNKACSDLLSVTAE